MTTIDDVLIVGAGPAGLALAAAVNDAGLKTRGLNPTPPDAPWPNTYGIWRDELEAPGLDPAWLGRQWQDCSVYTAGGEIPLRRTYGLFDNEKLQTYLLQRCAHGEMIWERGVAAGVGHEATRSQVTTVDGRTFAARLVVDASGHKPVFVQRPRKDNVALQAAYGVVGRFSRPPVRDDQMVLMDYRTDHLTPDQLQEPPTFLYAMDFGDGVYFVEETSLAHFPAVPYKTLKHRLTQRLAHRDIEVEEVKHVEHCLFPMNVPLPYLDQPVLGYGGAAGMVHPASGYQVGSALKRAPDVAAAIAKALSAPDGRSQAVARAAWQALWPKEQIRQRNLYLFGLANMLRFDTVQTQEFFSAFFALSQFRWGGYLSNTLTRNQVLRTMWKLFRRAPDHVRWSLVTSVGSAGDLLWAGIGGLPQR